MENILKNSFSNQDFEYLWSKDLKVFLMVQHQKTKEVSIRSDLSMEEVKKILLKKQLEEND